MKDQLILLALAWCITACVTPPQQKTGSADTSELRTSDSLMAYAHTPVATGCFQHLSQGGDTLLLRITSVNSGEVTGSLDYRFRQKDASSGTFLGSLHGDTLLAHYSYLAEGKRSVREVAFLRKGNNWMEGYGPTEGRDAVRRFSNRSQLQFGPVVFRPAACP